MTTDTIGTPVRLRAGTCDGTRGTYWAWPIDGYWDLHHTTGDYPDGTDVVAELLPSLPAARAAARELIDWDAFARRWGIA